MTNQTRKTVDVSCHVCGKKITVAAAVADAQVSHGSCAMKKAAKVRARVQAGRSK